MARTMHVKILKGSTMSSNIKFDIDPTVDNVLSICRDIDNITTLKELKVIGDFVHQKWLNLQRVETNRAIVEEKLFPGVKVEFDGRRGLVRGTLVKINTKTMKIKAEDGTMWRVTGRIVRRQAG